MAEKMETTEQKLICTPGNTDYRHTQNILLRYSCNLIVFHPFF